MLNSVALQIPASHDRCYFFYWGENKPSTQYHTYCCVSVSYGLDH